MTGAGFLALGVLLGALGAHALESTLSPDQLESYTTAVRYQMWMSLGLLIIQILSLQLKMTTAWVSGALVAGILCFSGSIYGLVFSDPASGLRSFLGPVTPIGGVLMIISWVALFIKLCRVSVAGTST